jgi:PST family polysaccharide transporter
LGLYQTIISLYGPIYLSLGRTDLDFKVSLLVETTIILAIVVGLQWGLVGLVFGLYAASVVNLFPTSMIPLRLLGLTARRFARSLAPTLTATVVMTAAVVVVGVAVAHWPHPATLGLQVSTGIVTYVLMCRALGVVALRDLTDGAVARWHRRSAAR